MLGTKKQEPWEVRAKRSAWQEEWRFACVALVFVALAAIVIGMRNVYESARRRVLKVKGLLRVKAE